jgi:hypothetical protein
MNTTPNSSAPAPPSAPGLSALVFSHTGEFMTESESRATVLVPQNRQIMKPGIMSQFVPYYQNSRIYER